MIHDATRAARRLIGFLYTGLIPIVDGDLIALNAQSICVHGDTPMSVEMARDIRNRLTAHGVQIASFIDA